MNGMYLIAVEQDPLRQGGLSRVNMSADADVPHLGNVDTHLF
jgi:hypothetical protein